MIEYEKMLKWNRRTIIWGIFWIIFDAGFLAWQIMRDAPLFAAVFGIIITVQVAVVVKAVKLRAQIKEDEATWSIRQQLIQIRREYGLD